MMDKLMQQLQQRKAEILTQRTEILADDERQRADLSATLKTRVAAFDAAKHEQTDDVASGEGSGEGSAEAGEGGGEGGGEVSPFEERTRPAPSSVQSDNDDRRRRAGIQATADNASDEAAVRARPRAERAQ